jgi:hypothetical protein
MSQLRSRLTFSNVVSVIALFIALTGGAYAAVKLKPNQVKSKNIAPNAVQGIDANESSFGTVPRAANADNASNAGNAAHADDASSVNGFSENDFQFGDGFDHAIAGTVDNGQTGGIVVFEGGVGVDCDSSPTIVYQDAPGDPFETDLWVDGVHNLVADGDPAGPFNPNPGPTEGTDHVHIWGGANTIADVLVSAVWNPGTTDCTVAFTAQENLNGAASTAAAAARAKSGLSRGGLPDGWVTPSRTP